MRSRQIPIKADNGRHLRRWSVMSESNKDLGDCTLSDLTSVLLFVFFVVWFMLEYSSWQSRLISSKLSSWISFVVKNIYHLSNENHCLDATQIKSRISIPSQLLAWIKMLVYSGFISWRSDWPIQMVIYAFEIKAEKVILALIFNFSCHALFQKHGS